MAGSGTIGVMGSASNEDATLQPTCVMIQRGVSDRNAGLTIENGGPTTVVSNEERELEQEGKARNMTVFFF